jgi:hypothetical protein
LLVTLTSDRGRRTVRVIQGIVTVPGCAIHGMDAPGPFISLNLRIRR